MDKEKLKGFAGSASRLVATSAQLAKKQAELAALKNVSLPKLHYSIGKRIARLEVVPPELVPFRDRIVTLESQLASPAPTELTSSQEEPKGFAQKAKQLAQQVGQKAAKATSDATASVQIQAAYVGLGKEAVARYGHKAVPKELRSDLLAVEEQAKTLAEEIAGLQSASAVGALTPRRLVLAAGSLAALVFLVFAVRGASGLLFRNSHDSSVPELSERNGSQSASKQAVAPDLKTTPPSAADINLNFLVRTAIVRAFGEESQKFTGDSFKGIRLGDGHDDEPGKSNAPFEAPHWLSVPPHQTIEKNGRPESTRVFVEKDRNRVVMVSAIYEGTALDNLLPDLLETFGKTPQEIIRREWEQNRGAASSATLRYTFPRTIVRVSGFNYSRPFPTSKSLVWVFDRKFIEKALLAYGDSVVGACKWLQRMRDIAERSGHVGPREAVPIKGCEIRNWESEDGEILLYVDTSRESAIRSVREAARKNNDFPRGLGQGGSLQPFDVAFFASSGRGQQLVICPDASASMRPPELKSYHPHLEGSILRTPVIEDIVLTFTSSIVQELLPPEGDEITIISRTSDTLWEPDETEPVDRRRLHITSRADGDRNEWTDQRGWKVRVSSRGGISLSRRKGAGL